MGRPRIQEAHYTCILFELSVINWARVGKLKLPVWCEIALLGDITMTESAARYALRTNNVAATDAIADNLEFLPNHLKKDPPFITARNLKGIMSKKGVTEYSQATNIFSYVESKVNSDNDAEEGQKWLQRFVEVLQLPDIGETGVARKIARSYG